MTTDIFEDYDTIDHDQTRNSFLAKALYEGLKSKDSDDCYPYLYSVNEIVEIHEYKIDRTVNIVTGSLNIKMTSYGNFNDITFIYIKKTLENLSRKEISKDILNKTIVCFFSSSSNASVFREEINLHEAKSTHTNLEEATILTEEDVDKLLLGVGMTTEIEHIPFLALELTHING